MIADIHLSPSGTPDGSWNNVTRRSVSAELLDAVLAEIVAGGHDHVLVLGDVSEFGTDDMLSAAFRRMADIGLRSWVVPGNHDVAVSPNMLSSAAAKASTSGVLALTNPRSASDGITVAGHGLSSADGGQTCRAINLADTAALDSRLLVWASHYPLLSQQVKLNRAGLRYPGDLVNLDQARAAAGRFRGPILVLHGHLHTAVVHRAGQILQIGVPAVVEWPHAWTDVRIDLTADAAFVQTTVTPIPGRWSTGDRNTVLDDREQSWQYTAKRWLHRAGRQPRRPDC